MRGHYSARGQMDTGPVQTALAGPAGPCIAFLAGRVPHPISWLEIRILTF